jgi:nucleoside-diphosphate-sugar epimerase
MPTTALIGATGFVGGNLRRQRPFDDLFCSSTIGRVAGREYDLVVCAAPSAVKWLANKHPEKDRAHVDQLLKDLAPVRARQFVLISTVDVYPEPIAVDEDTPIPPEEGQPYGRHRRAIEAWVRDRFDSALIIRLPQLFGPGLKKNLIYDLIHDNALHLVDRRSRLQFYDVTRLWGDIDAALTARVRLINLPVEPATAQQIAREVFGIDFTNETTSGPVHYDMRSNRLHCLKRTGPYVMDRPEWFARLRAFVAEEREHNGP